MSSFHGSSNPVLCGRGQRPSEHRLRTFCNVRVNVRVTHHRCHCKANFSPCSSTCTAQPRFKCDSRRDLRHDSYQSERFFSFCGCEGVFALPDGLGERKRESKETELHDANGVNASWNRMKTPQNHRTRVPREDPSHLPSLQSRI